ncbi:outer membrane protein assembly factor BamD [Oleiagrimonas sp.]|jgi:outer membrane protein assembly factor BamD|uniref:outer membrane protein assembly factor BamD n=1 Tax=Oleiagrimonas sp. TaxID=2010330 RepID=UPI0026323C56|nr:outer membrane protein assembly factor BamD [Oleiagrimonas sp.]MDA3914553.1 outer membrane protein assembly factor BamD [Oleiagrimonas sp.]
MRVLKIFSLITAVLLLASCSLFRTRANYDTLPVAKLYSTAHNALSHGNYANAEKAYQRLIARFPYGKYNEQSQVDLAYAQYKDNNPEDAYATINRFIKTYPAHKHIDYAYYLRGLINFNRSSGFVQRLVSQDQSRRDQGYRLQSFDDFSQLTRRFPGSKYAADARQRMIYLRNGLAEHEINVAKFYFHHRLYVASAHRAQYVIEHYQRSPETGDALALLVRSYRKLGLDKLAQQSLAVLKLNYPHHPFLSDPNWPHYASIWMRMIPFTNHH